MTEESARGMPIGYAEITADGILQLFVRAESEDGVVGHGLLVFGPGETGYAEMRQHIGPIEPGQKKPVYPVKIPRPSD